MAQPAFWLTVTPAYVIENFESLLKYVSLYQYSNEPPQSDFNRTVDVLLEVANNLVATTFSSNIDETPKWRTEFNDQPIDVLKALRIVGTAILAEKKRKKTAYKLYVGLIRMLSAINALQVELVPGYISILNACARRLQLKSLSLSYRDFDAETFSIPTLSINLSKTEWHEQDDKVAYFEGFGTTVFDAEGIKIMPVNHDDFAKYSVTGRLKRILESEIGVWAMAHDIKKMTSSDPNAVMEWSHQLLRSMTSVRPSKVRTKKTYAEGDLVEVRITNKIGLKIECVTTDPDYEPVKGKLLLDSYNLGVARDVLISQLKPGDVLPASYHPGDSCVFHISDDADEEKEFKETVIHTGPNSYSRCIFLMEYTFGTRWLSETGLQVNVLKKYDELVDFNHHCHDGACLKISLDEVTCDKNGKVVINGKFLPESEQDEPDIDRYTFEHQAAQNLGRSLIRYMNDWYENIEAEGKTGEDIPTDKNVVDTVGAVLIKSVSEDPTLTSVERVTRLILASAAFECTGSEIDKLIASRELSFIKAAVGFASGESPMSLQFAPDARISANQRTRLLQDVVDSLQKYKEYHYTVNAADNILGIQYDQIIDLVNASNTLINKIDSAELSRIKRNIAWKLGVGDAFKDATMQHSFYGTESDSLEFKSSCVLPPQNRRTGNLEGDLNMQAFAILKTVCAFLNSASGGDLLIGVNDNGYGIGLLNDLDILYSNQWIPEKNVDRLRIYLKNILDRSFVTNDGNVEGNAITIGHVLVNIENTKDNKEIIRVKVTPYPYDVVRIKGIPQGVKDVYYRTSGSSEPLDAAGVRNTRLEKLRKLDPKESKIAVILEAIDRKKQLMVREYQSSSGKKDRRVEPHCLMHDNSVLQAFDHSRKEMRLFRLSRMGQLEIMQNNWEYEKKHNTLSVDIFGMSQTTEHPGEIKKIKVSDFALLLLREECPSCKTDAEFKIETNSESDRNRFPYVVTLRVFDPAGVLRFTRGLPEHTLIVD